MPSFGRMTCGNTLRDQGRSTRVANAMNPPFADLVVAARRAEPCCAGTRVILIDGPAGSGKTTLAGRLAEVLDCQVLHGDDMYEGWDGLATLWEIERQIIEPLAAGQPGRFRRWDWYESQRAEEIVVPPANFVILEGVGVASPEARAYAGLVLWIEAPWDVCLERGMARDGVGMRDEWVAFHETERIVHHVGGTRGAADVILDGTAPIV